jgi:hypothetical protein
MELVEAEEMMPETDLLWQPDEDMAIIIANVNQPHFLNWLLFLGVINALFISFSSAFLTNPFNYLYENDERTLQ